MLLNEKLRKKRKAHKKHIMLFNLNEMKQKTKKNNHKK